MESIQENIIQTASQFFEKFGIRSVSIDTVCAELHISKKTFYTCFAQKEDLVDAVLTYQETQNFEKYSKLLCNKNAIDSLMFIIREVKKTVETESRTMCYDLEKYYPKVFAKHEAIKSNNVRMGFEHNLRQGIEEGFYRSDLDIELISLFHSIQIKNTFELMYQSPLKYSKKRLLEFFFDLIIHLIANENGLKYMEEHAKNEA